jgi:uncharacterized protein (TIGR03083 family)
MKPVAPILIVDLFPQERSQLLELLSALSEADWHRPTICCPGWSVQDVALHLFGDDVGLLSRTPDFKFPNAGEAMAWADLVAFINQANDLWLQATRRIGTELLLKLLALTGQEVHQRLRSLDLFALGVPVDWAGPDPAPIWLDVAREYTERWMHQQHIRETVNQPGLKDGHFFGPVLDTFVRALPHTFRTVEAGSGTILKLTISGEAGGEWFLIKRERDWALYQGVTSAPQATVELDQDTAWRVFTKGLSPAEAEQRTMFQGDRSLGLRVLDTVSIIA